MTNPLLKQNLRFNPPIPQFKAARFGKPLTAIAGANNTGKSLVLKYLKQQLGRSAYLIGPNRFYHVYHFTLALRDPNQLDQFENQFNQTFAQDQHNHEQNFFDLNQIIISLSNTQRIRLFELCGELLGCKLTMKRVAEDNDLSPSYIDMDGQNLAVGSTGTRLLLTMLGICMDDRFSTILIDEPELGLSPKVQQAFVSFLADPAERAKYFPHLASVYVATHSHLFLNRKDIESNFIVSKEGANIAMAQVRTISEFHRLQFNLLGNSLEAMFLPAAIVVTEGKTDAEYIDRIMGVRFPSNQISTNSSGGDPKRKLQGLKDAFGDLSRSPLRSRIFVVLDSVHQPGLRRELTEMGVLPENIVIWDRNGIEYVYPDALLCAIFNCPKERLTELQIRDDVVSLNGVQRKKNELKTEVLAKLTESTVLPQEVETKLVSRIRDAIA
jgi:predicted ATPase